MVKNEKKKIVADLILNICRQISAFCSCFLPQQTRNKIPRLLVLLLSLKPRSGVVVLNKQIPLMHLPAGSVSSQE